MSGRIISILALLLWASGTEQCLNLETPPHTYGFYQDGDVIIGALIGIFSVPGYVDHNFTRTGELLPCSGFQTRPYRWVQAVLFAVEEINRTPSLLPGVKLGFHVMDSCNRHPYSLKAAFSMIAGGKHPCPTTKPAKIIIGDSASTPTIVLSSTLSPLNFPVISYLASCPCLSDRVKYPNFFRTVPSDAYQARTMAHMAKRFGWSWVGAVVANTDYGLGALQAFEKEIKGTEICLDFVRTLSRERIVRDAVLAAKAVQESSARVIIVFAWYGDVDVFLTELTRRNVTGRLFLASEIWSTSDSLLNNPNLYRMARGTVGVALRGVTLPGFEEHIQQLRPSRFPADVFLGTFWENTFGCSLSQSSTSAYGTSCSGVEGLEQVESRFTDFSELRVTYTVYLAVYAAAHALHSLLGCAAKNGSCSSTDAVTPEQLLKHLKTVHFTTSLGEDFFFQNGDVPPFYDLVNWQSSEDGQTLSYAVIGKVKGDQLIINESAITWPGESGKVPVSECSAECPPGTRKGVRKGFPICCFDCLPCAEGEMSNASGSSNCYRCPKEFWSNVFRNECLPREIEFLSFKETLGISLAGVAVSGAVVTAMVAIIFLYHRNTPIVKANNSELSFLLLASLKLCFLCALIFIGRPSVWSCKLQKAGFAISFVLCISCILVKTIVVLVAFHSAKPGSSALIKWFGPRRQRGSVLLFTCVQVVICSVWLLCRPPSPHQNFRLHRSKVIVECAIGSFVGWACVLGYGGLLAAVCFLLAFLARKLPDNFNEAKFITFSMLIFFSVWIAFVPAYVSSPGKYSVVVEIFAILASSFGLLLCIFLPKCYIILLKPENNNRKFLMGKAS